MTPLDRISQLTDENAELRSEIERLENLTASGIHTCHADCQRPMCVLRRERDKALAELERVTAERDAARAEAVAKRDLVALRARVADLEAAESLHWITEEELRQSRARVAELVAALREEKRIHPEDFQQGDFRERAIALARAESATPTKHPDTERLDAIEDGGLDVFESHGEWYVGAAEPCRTLRAALDTARKQETA